MTVYKNEGDVIVLVLGFDEVSGYNLEGIMGSLYSFVQV